MLKIKDAVDGVIDAMRLRGCSDYTLKKSGGAFIPLSFGIIVIMALRSAPMNCWKKYVESKKNGIRTVK